MIFRNTMQIMQREDQIIPPDYIKSHASFHYTASELLTKLDVASQIIPSFLLQRNQWGKIKGRIFQ